eukprot:gene1083-10602_t
MKFGNQFALRVEQNELWSHYFVDYIKLKNLIKKMKVEKESMKKKLHKETMKKFFTEIKEELTKFNEWYLKIELQCQRFLKEIETKYEDKDEYDKEDQFFIISFSEKIFSLKDFKKVNGIAIEKLIKKFKKYIGVNEEIENFEKDFKDIFQQLLIGLDGIESKIHPILLKNEKVQVKKKNDTTLPEPIFIDELKINKLERGKIFSFWVSIIVDPMGLPVSIPVLVATGVKEGPVLGIVSSLHGNEINGIPLIHRLFEDLDVNTIIGTVIAVPIANTIGYNLKQKNFNDGADLNQKFPGVKDGNCSQQYCYNFFHKIIKQFEYLIDLHTASSGRINSLFVRANMNDQIVSKLAHLQNPQIIIHQKSVDKSLRNQAMKIGIKAISVEIGNPQIFQKRFINHALLGVTQIMSFLKMIPFDEDLPYELSTLCSGAKWIKSDVGGVLTVVTDINKWVKKGDIIAIVKDPFGNFIKEYKSEYNGIVIEYYSWE